MTKPPKTKYPFLVQRISKRGKRTHWFALAIDLPGCIAAADTLDETLDLLDDAIKEHLKTYKEEGWEIPVPSSAVEYSLKLLKDGMRESPKQGVRGAPDA